jgi:hypothetical protein
MSFVDNGANDWVIPRSTAQTRADHGPDDWVVPTPKDVSGTQAFGLGATQGITANHADELAGIAAAGDKPAAAGASGPERETPIGTALNVAKLVYEHLTGNKGEARQSYEDTRNAVRAEEKGAQEQHPYLYGAGEVTGALATPVPGSQMVRGVTIGERMARSAKAGAGYAAAAGFGSGEGAVDSAAHAAISAPIGAIVGGAAPVATDLLVAGGRRLAEPVQQAWRRFRDPEGESARRVTEHYQAAQSAHDPMALTPRRICRRAGSRPARCTHRHHGAPRRTARAVGPQYAGRHDGTAGDGGGYRRSLCLAGAAHRRLP